MYHLDSELAHKSLLIFLFSKIYNWFSSVAVSNQVSHPHVTVGRIIVLYIWILLLYLKSLFENRFFFVCIVTYIFSLHIFFLIPHSCTRILFLFTTQRMTDLRVDRFPYAIRQGQNVMLLAEDSCHTVSISYTPCSFNKTKFIKKAHGFE